MIGKVLLITPNHADVAWFSEIIGRNFPRSSVKQAESAEEGYALANGGLVNFAIIYSALEDMTGTELCRRFRVNNITAEMPIMIYHYDQVSSAQHLDDLESGADCTIAVPCQEAEVLANLRNMARINRTLQRLRNTNSKLLAVAGARSRDLFHAEERSRHYFNTHRDGIIVVECDKEGNPKRYSQVNQIMCDWLGYTPKEFLELPIEALISQERANAIMPRVHTILEHKEISFTGVFKDRKGREIPLDFNVIHQDTGDFPELVFVAKQCMSDEVLDQDASPHDGHMFFELDMASGMAKALGAARQLLGLDLAPSGTFEWIKRETRIHPEDLPSLQETLDIALNSIGKYSISYRLQTVDGGWRMVEEQGFVLPGETGEAARLIGSIHDADLRRSHKPISRDEGKAHQQLISLGLLAGGVAHDFNNILASMMGHCELAIGRLGDHPDIKEDLREVLSSARHARDLVRQILALTQADNGQPSILYPHVFAREAFKLMQSSVPRNIRWIDEINRKSGPVLANVGKIRQAFVALLTQTFECFGGEGGVLILRVGDVDLSESDGYLEAGDYVRISVLGELNAIPQDSAETKLQRDGRLDLLESLSPLFRESGARFKVEIEPDESFEFSAYYPRMAYQDMFEDEAKNLEYGQGRVLMVDDEAPILRLGKKALGRLGFQVDTTNSPLDALAMFSVAPESYDVVITDQMMPKMGGMELAAELRKLREDIPIILCTGFSEQFSESELEQAGIVEVLIKPMRTTELCNLVHRVCSKKPANTPPMNAGDKK